MRRRKQEPETKPYCRFDEHTWVQVVGGQGYDEDYDVQVCIYCHAHQGLRKDDR